MIILTLIFQLFISQPAMAGAPSATPKQKAANASACRDQLRTILQKGKSAVFKKYPAGSACRTGAMNGAEAGKKAGCESGFEMQLLLAPYYYEAKKVCETTCAKEGKKSACESIVNTGYMTANGVNGLRRSLSKVNYTPNPSVEITDGLYYEDFDSAEEFQNAVFIINEEQNKDVQIEI